MASPQKENGYTPIANEILEALALFPVSGEAGVVCGAHRADGTDQGGVECRDAEGPEHVPSGRTGEIRRGEARAQDEGE